ncbi:hypothetical protein OG21DRAFT_1451066, partial [Imleria badia]
MWKTITTEYESKTSLVQADLRAKFQNLSCPEKGDLRAHLDKLRASREELAAVGVNLTNAKYSSNIIRSLPRTYQNHVAHLSSAAHLLSKEISADDLMNYVIQEHDRLTTTTKSE